VYEDEGGRSRTKPEGIKSKVERESHMREQVYKVRKAREAHKDVNVIE